MNPARFPQLASYLAGLPAGLESYSTCQTKASLALSAMDGHDLASHADDLPDALAGFVREPPPAGVWIPATWSDGIFHAVCDLYYPTEAAMQQWTFERSTQLAKNPLYRGLLKAVGPTRMFRMGPRMNRLFQRGTTLANEIRDRSAVSRMTFPPGLHDRVNLSSNVPALRAMAVITGGKGVKARMLEYSETHALYECTWV
ncbi:MAG: hypothetical protein CMN30_15560 [Sandaracinus sp.]|nr:hypothetical protein [Sandaracinus sp.]|tara:strand:- start:3827 stop:4426 length:600 start_codon:yes stop_codon:yes gene_type:complete